jgi:hypothetical protein
MAKANKRCTFINPGINAGVNSDSGMGFSHDAFSLNSVLVFAG